MSAVKDKDYGNRGEYVFLFMELEKVLNNHACLLNENKCSFCSYFKNFINYDIELGKVRFKKDFYSYEYKIQKEVVEMVKDYVSVYSVGGKKCSGLYRESCGYYFDIAEFDKDSLIKLLSALSILKGDGDSYSAKEINGYKINDVAEFANHAEIVSTAKKYGLINRSVLNSISTENLLHIQAEKAYTSRPYFKIIKLDDKSYVTSEMLSEEISLRKGASKVRSSRNKLNLKNAKLP